MRGGESMQIGFAELSGTVEALDARLGARVLARRFAHVVADGRFNLLDGGLYDIDKRRVGFDQARAHLSRCIFEQLQKEMARNVAPRPDIARKAFVIRSLADQLAEAAIPRSARRHS